jgi:Phage integrase family
MIVNTDYGKPFTVDGFSQWLRSAITAAGLPLDCQPHGLRKAAGRRLAEAGCSAHEIMAVLGHKTLSEAERYTREADQARLATEAMMKLEGRRANRFAPNRLCRFGQNNKIRRRIKVNKKRLALPRGLQDLHDINMLAINGTSFRSMGSQGFSPIVSHRFLRGAEPGRREDRHPHLVAQHKGHGVRHGGLERCPLRGAPDYYWLMANSGKPMGNLRGQNRGPDRTGLGS